MNYIDHLFQDNPTRSFLDQVLLGKRVAPAIGMELREQGSQLSASLVGYADSPADIAAIKQHTRTASRFVRKRPHIQGILGAWQNISDDLVAEHLHEMGAVGGKVRLWQPTIKGGFGNNTAALKAIRQRESQEISRLRGLGLSIPGLGSTSSMHPHADALESMLTAIAPKYDKLGNLTHAGFEAAVHLDEHGVGKVRLNYQGFEKRGVIEMPLNMQYGNKIPVSPQISGMKVGGFSAVGMRPGNYAIGRSIGIVDGGKVTIKTNQLAYLAEAQQLLLKHASGDTAGESVQRQITILNKKYAGTHISSENAAQDLTRSHDVVLVRGRDGQILSKQSGKFDLVAREAFDQNRRFVGFGTGAGQFDAFAEGATESMDQLVGTSNANDLFITGLKQEAYLYEGVVSKLSHRDILPFAQYSDPARQSYQYVNRGRLAGGRYLTEYTRRLKPSSLPRRATVPWFGTRYLRAAEEYSINNHSAPTQIMADVGIINDPRFALGIPSEGLDYEAWARKNGALESKHMRRVIDSAQGDMWVNSRTAKALTSNVTSQIDINNPHHRYLMSRMQTDPKFLFTAEGQEVVRRGGLDTAIMVGRMKGVISATYGDIESPLSKYAKQVNAREVDVLMSGVNLAKFPETGRAQILGSVLEKITDPLHKTGNKVNSGSKYVRKYMSALSEIAATVNADIVMMPETTVADMGEEYAVAARKMRAKRATQSLRGEKFNQKRFFAQLRRGYLPMFVDKEGQEMALGTPEINKINRILKKLAPGKAGLAIEEEMIASARPATKAELAAANLKASPKELADKHGIWKNEQGMWMKADSYKGWVVRSTPVSNRQGSTDLQAKVSRFPGNPMELPESGISPSDRGFKIQQVGLKRLRSWGDAGVAVAEALEEAVYSPEGRSFANKAYLVSKLAGGAEVTQEGLEAISKGTQQRLEIVGTAGLKEKLGNISRVTDINDSLEGTYYSKKAMDALGHGFVLELDNPIEYDLGGEKVARRQFFLPGPLDEANQIRSKSALTSLGRAQEELVLAVTGNKSAQDIAHAAQRFENEQMVALASKKGSLSKKFLQPRIAGSGWGLAVRNSNVGFGEMLIGEDYAKELGVHRLLKEEGHAMALLERSPDQGAGNMMAVKVRLGKQNGYGIHVSPEFSRAMGDFDRDQASFVFARTQKMRRGLESLWKKQYDSSIRKAESLGLVFDEIWKMAKHTNDRGALDLGRMVAAEEAAASGVSGLEKNFLEQNRYLMGLATGEKDEALRRLTTMRMISTKELTGQIYNTMEQLHHYVGMQNSLPPADRFPNVRAMVESGKAAYDMSVQASSILQVTTELASIKKAKEPMTGLIDLMTHGVQSGEMLEESEFLARYRTEFIKLQEEIITGGKGIALPASQRAFMAKAHEDMITHFGMNQNTKAGIDLIQQAHSQGGEASEWVEALGHHFYQAHKQIHADRAEFQIRIGQKMSAAERIIGMDAAHMSPGKARDAIMELAPELEQYVNLPAAQQAEARHRSKAAAAAGVDSAMAASYRQAQPYMDKVDDVQIEKFLGDADQMDDIFSRIGQWWNKLNPMAKAGIGVAGGLVALAGVKNMLFPGYQPEYPRQPDYLLHNPPFLGYNSGPGFRDSIPPPPMPGIGMDLPMPMIQDYGNMTALNNPIIGPGMGSSGYMAPVMSESSGSPLVPAPYSDGADFDPGPIAEVPKSYVTPPAYTRPFGQPGNYVESGGVDVQVRGDSYNQSAARLGSMNNKRVEVVVSDDSLSSSIMHLRGKMRDMDEGRIYFGAVDPTAAMGA